MKKILATTIFAFLCVSFSFSGTASNFDHGIVVGSDAQESLLINSVGEGDLGVIGDAEVYGGIRVSSGILRVPEFFLNIAAAANTTFRNASEVSTLASATTAWTLAEVDYTDVIEPRNVVAIITYTAGGDTTTCTTAANIVGKDLRGNAVTERIVFSTNVGTGVYAYSTITSITVEKATMTAVMYNPLISIGTGVKIGLSNDMIWESDIVKVVGDSVPDTGYTLNKVYNTITFTTAPDGNHSYKVWTRPQQR